MRAIRFDELITNVTPEVLPTTVTFGAGLFPDGTLGSQSELNAKNTAIIHNMGLVEGAAITTGFGPDTGIEYPITESEGMAKRILELTKDGGHAPSEIIIEPYARDTLGSIWNLAQFIEEEGLEALTFVGAEYHVTRAAHMGRRVFGKSIEIIPIESCPVTSKPAMVKELATTGLYRALTVGARSRLDQSIRHKAYREAVKPFKRAVQATRDEDDGGRYGGKGHTSLAAEYNLPALSE